MRAAYGIAVRQNSVDPMPACESLSGSHPSGPLPHDTGDSPFRYQCPGEDREHELVSFGRDAAPQTPVPSGGEANDRGERGGRGGLRGTTAATEEEAGRS